MAPVEAAKGFKKPEQIDQLAVLPKVILEQVPIAEVVLTRNPQNKKFQFRIILCVVSPQMCEFTRVRAYTLRTSAGHVAVEAVCLCN